MPTRTLAAQLTQDLCDVLTTANRLQAALHAQGFKESGKRFFRVDADTDHGTVSRRVAEVNAALGFMRTAAAAFRDHRLAALDQWLDPAIVDSEIWQPFPATVPAGLDRVELRGRWRGAVPDGAPMVQRIAERRSILTQSTPRWCVGLEPIEATGIEFTEWRAVAGQ